MNYLSAVVQYLEREIEKRFQEKQNELKIIHGLLVMLCVN